MRHVADRPGLMTGQVPGPGSVELFVDLLLLHRLAQLLLRLGGHDRRYHLAAMVNHIVGVTGGHLAHEDHGNEAADSLTSQHAGSGSPVQRREANRALRVRYRHGYHGALPPMPLIAPFARVARSTNRFHALSLPAGASRAAVNQTSIDWPSVVPASSSRFVNSLRRVTVARLAATGSH